MSRCCGARESNFESSITRVCRTLFYLKVGAGSQLTPLFLVCVFLRHLPAPLVFLRQMATERARVSGPAGQPLYCTDEGRAGGENGGSFGDSVKTRLLRVMFTVVIVLHAQTAATSNKLVHSPSNRHLLSSCLYPTVLNNRILKRPAYS